MRIENVINEFVSGQVMAPRTTDDLIKPHAQSCNNVNRMKTSRSLPIIFVSLLLTNIAHLQSQLFACLCHEKTVKRQILSVN